MDKNENNNSINNDIELDKNENNNSINNDIETKNNFDFGPFDFQNNDDEYEKSEKKKSFVDYNIKESQVVNYDGELINPKEFVNISITEENIEYPLDIRNNIFLSTIMKK